MNLNGGRSRGITDALYGAARDAWHAAREQWHEQDKGREKGYWLFVLFFFLIVVAWEIIQAVYQRVSGRDMMWWQWVGIIVWTVLPIPSGLLGTGGLNIFVILGLAVVWLAWPAVGPVIYTGTWVNLVLYRVLQLRRTQIGTLGAAFPMTVSAQNASSSLLSVLGIVGAIRSGFAGDWLGVALGHVDVTIWIAALEGAVQAREADLGPRGESR